jgi:DNA-binding MarR family transcriptional regulator
MVLNIAIAVGVGFAYASMPALINAAVPISETAAANGINALARSLGTSVSSAVIGAVLAGMTVSFAGSQLPSMAGFRTAMVVAAAVAALAAVLTLLIPVASVDEALAPVSWLEPSTYLVCDRIDAVGALSLRDIAREFEIDVPTAGRHVTQLLREGLALGSDNGDSLSFRLTPRGRERLYQHRAAVEV